MKKQTVVGLVVFLLVFSIEENIAAHFITGPENPISIADGLLHSKSAISPPEKPGSILLNSFLSVPDNAAGSAADRNTATLKHEQDSPQQVMALVKAAATQVRNKGEGAFSDLGAAGSRWRKGESYIFVVDVDGTMLVHADPNLVGKNQLELQDVNGRRIIQGLLEVVNADPAKPEGWHHYQWAAPGKDQPRWKSSYAQLVKAPSGKSYLVGTGYFTDRTEKEFVVDAVKNAVAVLEKQGEAAFPLLRDPKGPFLVKDAYLIVIDMNGVELLNPAFPEYVGKNVLDLKDSRGKQFIKEMLQVAEKSGSGWVNYMWPKPGETGSSEKSTYVSKAKLGDKWVLVGCGVYLNEASKTAAKKNK